MPPSCSMNSPENSGERCCKFAAPIQSTLNKSFTVYRRDSRRYEGVRDLLTPGSYGHFCPKVPIAAGRNQSLPPLWQTHHTAFRFWGARLERSATPRVSLFPKMTKFPTGVGGLKICSPFAFLFSIATSGNGKELSDNFVPNCPEIWGEVGQSIFGSVAANGKLRPLGTSEDDPNLGRPLLRPSKSLEKSKNLQLKKAGSTTLDPSFLRRQGVAFHDAPASQDGVAIRYPIAFKARWF